MNRFSGKTVAIVGISIEGLDVVQYMVNHGATVLCLDRRNEKELGETATLLHTMPVSLHLGNDHLSFLDTADIIVRSPGIALWTPEFTDTVKGGKELTSLTKLFFELCPCPIIGVTGTKGKGTTSTLIYEMLVKSGKHAYLGGNVGTPLLSRVDTMNSRDIVVLELSSFQLEDCTKSPHIAVVLRVTQDHLANADTLATNFHLTREAYVEAKKQIVRYQTEKDCVIVNADDQTSLSFTKETKGKIYTVRRGGEKADAYVRDHTVYVNYQGKELMLVKKGECKLRGDHNLENIGAAALAAMIAGVSFNDIQHVAKIFPGLPYRLTEIKTVNGVLFVNDSFSTVPETTIAAIQSFDEPVTLIIGGSEKKSDFTQMGKEIAKSSVKKLIVIGDMTNRIVEAVKAGGYKKELVTGLMTMHSIIANAYASSKQGDVVLLSPACASFDMFKNYKDRGNQFSYEVSKLS